MTYAFNRMNNRSDKPSSINAKLYEQSKAFVSEATRLQMRQRVFSEPHKQKIKEALTGVKHSEARRTKNRLNQLGKRLSEETKIKISKAQTGKRRPRSFIDKMTGRKNTKATKELMSRRAEKYEYHVQSPKGDLIVVTNLLQFCKKNNLNRNRMTKPETNVRGFVLLLKREAVNPPKEG